MTASPFIWILVAVCLVLSFILSGMEAGVFALSRLRIRQLMRAGRHSARVLHDYLDHPENFLWTILVGNTIANLIILGWLVVLLHGALGRHVWGFWLAYLVVVFLFYALFDLLPKMLFRAHANRLCVFLARPFRLVHWVLRPLVALVEWVSAWVLRWSGGKAFTGHLFGNREELRLVMQESAQALSSEERTMINRVLDLQSLTVRQVMAPLTQAVMVTAQTPVRDLLALGRQHAFTRFPVCENRDGRPHLIGLVHLDGLLFQTDLDPLRPVAEHVKPALFLEEDLRLEIALQRLQRSGQRSAIVLARDGREIGLVSLRDVLRLVFGEVSL